MAVSPTEAQRSLPRSSARLTPILALLLVAPCAKSVAAGESAGDAVFSRARAVAASVKDKSMRVRMTIFDPDGGERLRLLRGYEKKTDAGRRILWIFESPTELTGTGFLAWQEGGRPDQLWVYFPGQRRVRRIPPSLRRDHFQGSAFTFEDLTAVFYLDYNSGEHVLEREEPCEAASQALSRCQLVATTFPEGEFAYRKMRSWVRTDDHLPVRVEFFDDSLLKVLRVLRTEKIGGVPTVVAMEMLSPRDAYRTQVEFFEIEYNRGLDEAFFTVGSLSKMGK